MNNIARYLLLTSLTLLCFGQVLAQPTLLWDHYYGGSDNEEAHALLPTDDGGCMVAGLTESFGQGEFGRPDIWILKLDDAGSIEWSGEYGVADSLEQVYSLIETNDGGYLAAGYKCEQWGFGGGDTILLKIDADGTQQWLQQYGGSQDDGLRFIHPDPAGGYIACGWTRSSGAGFVDAWVIRFDDAGSITWAFPFGGTEYDVAKTVYPHPDGGYLVTGYTSSMGAGGNDAWVFKLDSSGNLEWEQAYGSTGMDRAYFSTPSNDGNFVLTGIKEMTSEGDLWILKIDPAGNVIWEQTHDMAVDDEGHYIEATNDGGFAVAAWAGYAGNPWTQMWILKLDNTGEITWDTQFGGPASDMANVVRQIGTQDFLAGGGTLSGGNGRVDMWVLKLHDNEITAVDIPTQTCASLTCFPNPFNPTTTIELQLPQGGTSTLKLFDCSGREIDLLHQSYLPAGTHNFTLDASELGSGVYFAHLEINGLTQTEKIVLLK